MPRILVIHASPNETRLLTGCAASLSQRTLAWLLLVLSFSVASPAIASDMDIRLEGGSAWFSRNDVRIPSDTGTRFDLLDLTGTGATPYFRFYSTWHFNDRHALRLTIAPLQAGGTGILDKDVTFDGSLFTAGTPVKGSYQFNTYRLTYRWTFYDQARWRWGFGGALLVRDADITLQQGATRASNDDLGLVPLLHVHGEYRVNEHTSLLLDVEGAWSPMGRAVDAALMAEHRFDSGWYLGAGYRTLEGGADNDDVYTFAWLHYAMVSVGYRF